MRNTDDTDYLNYYPLSQGEVPVSSTKTTKFVHLEGDKGKHFQFGNSVDSLLHLSNKIDCREERISKYYQKTLSDEKIKLLARGLLGILRQQNGDIFEFSDNGLKNPYTEEELIFDSSMNLVKSKYEYLDAFDALACQVPEDIVLMTVDPSTKEDKVTLAHLMSPAEWSAEWAINKSFAQIHENVKKANGNLVISNPSMMVQGLVKLPEPMQRVGAVSWRSYRAINLHSENAKPEIWDWNNPDQKVFLRFERQTVTAWPEINSFMLTVRGYYNDLRTFDRIQAAIAALESPKPDINRKAFIAEHGQSMLSFLKRFAPVV
jgi:hypothetical protein